MTLRLGTEWASALAPLAFDKEDKNPIPECFRAAHEQDEQTESCKADLESIHTPALVVVLSFVCIPGQPLMNLADLPVPGKP